MRSALNEPFSHPRDRTSGACEGSERNYSSASEVVGEALRLLDARDQMREQRLGELKRRIAIGEEKLSAVIQSTPDSFLRSPFQENRIEARKPRRKRG